MRSSRECFGKWVNENGYNDEDSVFHNHINSCAGVRHLYDLLKIGRSHAERGKFDVINFSAHLIDKIVKVFDKVKCWEYLLFKEAQKAEDNCPSINNGLKASSF